MKAVMTLAPTPATLGRLRRLCGGAVHLPGDSGYAAACAVLGTADGQAGIVPRPAAVLYPGDEDEVAEALVEAAALGLRVLVQRTGLGPRPAGSLSDVILVRTSGIGGVRAAQDSLTARAGSLCGDVALAATVARLDLPTGDPRHGIVGGTVLGPDTARATIVGARAVLADGTMMVAGQSDGLVCGLRAGVLPAAVVTELTLVPVVATAVAIGVPPGRADRATVRGRLDPTGLFLLPD
jgi:FAD/FMN-containing dehydrogenase